MPDDDLNPWRPADLLSYLRAFADHASRRSWPPAPPRRDTPG